MHHQHHDGRQFPSLLSTSLCSATLRYGSYILVLHLPYTVCRIPYATCRIRIRIRSIRIIAVSLPLDGAHRRADECITKVELLDSKSLRHVGPARRPIRQHHADQHIASQARQPANTQAGKQEGRQAGSITNGQ